MQFRCHNMGDEWMQHINWNTVKRKHSHMMRKGFALTILCLVLMVQSFCAFAQEEELFSVNLFNRIYLGEISEEIPEAYLDQLTELRETISEYEPNLDGLSPVDYQNLPLQYFVPSDQYEEDLLIFGKVFGKQLIGPCMILKQSDGRKVFASFGEDGRINGKIRTVFPDGRFYSESTLNGLRYGYLYENDAAGKRTGKKWYFQGTLVDDWNTAAISVTYDDLTANENGFLLKPVIIDGIVKTVFCTDDRIGYLIEDDDGHVYLTWYPDKEKRLFFIAEAPILEEGEQVHLCGCYSGLEDYGKLTTLPVFDGWKITSGRVSSGVTNENVLREISKWIKEKQDEEVDDREEKLPSFVMVSAVADNKEMDNLHLADTYVETVYHPTEYWNRSKEIIGEVICQTEDLQKLVVETDEGDLFIVICKEEILEQLEGRRVRYKGKLYGTGRLPFLDHQSGLSGYLFLPEIRLKKYKEYALK